MAQRDPERYTQGDDGLIVEKVGRWAVNKLKILTDYVYASGGARKNFARPGTAYIDVFCGPGRSLIRDTTKFIDGSPVAAFKRALESPGRFTSINVSDADDELLAVAEKRLNAINAPVRPVAGFASAAMPKIVQSLDPYGLHLAFLDPHNLGTLSFDLFEQLAKLKHIDVIAHVSLSDLQRNADRYADEDYDQFDKFAPGWRDKVGTDMNQEALRRGLIQYWSDKVMALGLPRARHCELITGDQGQRLYWLILLARADLAHQLWEKISSAAKAPGFDFY
jgi:three-Cys-motif partner protein